jgi:hypothetical protein
MSSAPALTVISEASVPLNWDVFLRTLGPDPATVDRASSSRSC